MLAVVTIDEYMTVSDSERQAYIESLDGGALLQLGIDLYNAGHYWHAHEAWEAVWLETPREDPRRLFYQGLIQVTAAFAHLVHNEYPGTVSLLASAVEKLERYPSVYEGIDLGALLDGVRALRETLVALGEKGIASFDRQAIPKIATSSRGDGV